MNSISYHLLSKNLAVGLGSLTLQNILDFFRKINRKQRGMFGADNLTFFGYLSPLFIGCYGGYPAMIEASHFLFVPSRSLPDKDLTHRKRLEQYKLLQQNNFVADSDSKDFQEQVVRRENESDLDFEYRIMGLILGTIALTNAGRKITIKGEQ